MVLVAESEVAEWCETESWVHFRNGVGLVLSCRISKEAFPSGDKGFELKNGSKGVLPKGLGDATDRAEEFSTDQKVKVILSPGKLRLRATGASGWYKETFNIAYDGPDIEFMASPKLLKDLTKQPRDCVLNESRLKVDTGTYQYITALGAVQ
jgi:hypothetical protein